MAAAAIALLALVSFVGAGVLLYSAVRAEGSRLETTTRAEAEREARRDTEGDRRDRTR